MSMATLNVAAAHGEASDTVRRVHARAATGIEEGATASGAASGTKGVEAHLRETRCVSIGKCSSPLRWSCLTYLLCCAAFPRRTQDRRDRSRSRNRSRSRSRGRDRGRGRDRDQHRGKDRDRDRRSKEQRLDRPSHKPSDDGPSPRSITEVPIIAYADGGYEVCTSVPPDITVAALAAALFNAGMTPPPPVEYGSGAGVRSIA